MILPTKHISLRQSLLNVSAIALDGLRGESTVTQLWERLRVHPEVATFERFVLALDLLYLMDLIELKDGLLRRREA